MPTTPSGAQRGGEAAKSMKVLEELFSSLSVSKSIDETNAAANNLANLLNGPEEQIVLPIK